MAVLVHLGSGARHRVQSECLIGRGNTCHVRLEDRRVSSSHAELRWIGAAWEIRDLGSRNGTYVNGQRLDKGEPRVMAQGMTLAFGDPGDVWELADSSPPAAYAQSHAGVRRDAQAGLIIVPDPDHPAYTIFDRHGRWIVESADGTQRDIADGAILTTADDRWIVHLPIAQERTQRCDEIRPLLREIALHFTVSRDQENIDMQIIHPGGTIELPSRVYMELLLRLAEERMNDQNDREISDADKGWVFVPTLLARLGIDDDSSGGNRLRQHIYQARTQVADAGVIGAADIVQRRKTIATDGYHRVSQLRIGVKQLDIDWR